MGDNMSEYQIGQEVAYIKLRLEELEQRIKIIEEDNKQKNYEAQ